VRSINHLTAAGKSWQKGQPQKKINLGRLAGEKYPSRCHSAEENPGKSPSFERKRLKEGGTEGSSTPGRCLSTSLGFWMLEFEILFCFVFICEVSVRRH